MYNPKGNDTNREWFEAINLGDPVYVKTGKKGWRIFDGKSNRVIKGEDFTWNRNEIIIFTKDKNTFLSEYPQVNNIKIVESSISLNNKEGEILILDENKNILASFKYNSSLGGNGNGFSLINENGVIKEGNFEKGTPGIYPEPPKLENKPLQEVTKSTTTEIQSFYSTTTKEESFQNSQNLKDDKEEKQNQNINDKNDEINYDILITEFLPNPVGRDENEFIEIYNNSEKELSLENLFLVVGNKKIKLSGKIKPHEYLVFYKKDYGFNIRNKGEEIKIITDKDEQIFSIKYSTNAPQGKSFSRNEEGKWYWTIPSPGKPNIFSQDEENSIEEINNEGKIYEALSIKENLENKNLGNYSSNLYNKANIPIESFKFIFLGFLISLLAAIVITLFLK